MPILQGAVTLSRYRVELPKDFDPRRAIPKALRARAFEPIDPKGDEDRAVGFVELEDADATEFAVGNLFRGEHALFSYRVDTLKVSGAALKAELEKWAQAFEREQDRKPTRSEKSQTKAHLRDMLRKRATPITKTHDVAWNLKSARLDIWAASRKVVDEIHLALEEGLGVTLEPLVPATQARQAGVPEELLGPTAELVGMELKAEVDHGQA